MAISKISANMIDGSLTSSLVTGSLPAVDGSALIGAGNGIDTETTSDPTISSNPSATGHIWSNKSTGEMFICTDATAGANVWINVGEGSGNVWQFQGTLEGYTAGGNVVGGSVQNIIQKYLFSNNTLTTDLGDLTTAASLGSGQSSGTHGYVSGGHPFTTRIEKFEFSTSNNATSHGNLEANCSESAGHSSLTHGYISGGNPINDDIKKFSFASSSTASNIGTLPNASGTKAATGLSGSEYGYVVAGGRPGSSPFQQDEIERFSYASDSNASEVGTLINLRSSASGSTSSTHGFVHGGDTPSSNTASIEKFSLSSGTTSASHGNSVAAKSGAAGSSSTTHGYSAGGQSSGNITGIDKYSYATSGTAATHGDLRSVGLWPTGHQY